MRRRSIVFAACALTAVVVLPGAPALAAFGSSSPFCAPTILHDYLKPVKTMPPQHGTVELVGFGPKNVTVGGFYETEELLTGGGKVNVSVAYPRSTEHNDWVVTVKLASVDRQGDVEQLIGSFQRPIGEEGSPSSQYFSFHLAARPRIYRVQLTVRDRKGGILGRFGKYIRVLPAVPDTEFLLSAATYHRGEVVLGRVENYGTTWVSYGVEYRIERFDGEAWLPAPESPKEFIQPEIGTGPGTAGICLEFPIPPTLPSGHYRMVKEFGTGGRFGQPKHLVFAPEFDVIP